LVSYITSYKLTLILGNTVWHYKEQVVLDDKEMDSRKKSLYKSISWRIIAIIIGAMVTYVFIGSVEITLQISIIANAIAIAVYYVHERVWNRY
jgi:uncharacterized membrane protein